MTDYSDLVEQIVRAAAEFDKPAATKACDDLIDGIRKDKEPPAVTPLKRTLSALRNKRYFDLMEAVAVAAIGAGQRDPQVRRQYAQGLIDTGKVSAAMEVLAQLVADTSPGGAMKNPSENAEARGLVGRACKQAYVNAVNRPSLIDGPSEQTPPAPEEYRARVQTYRGYLERAIKAYGEVYEADPDRNLWHGINTVACVCRAERDGIAPDPRPDARRIAADILEKLESIEPRTNVAVPDRATALEACVALGRTPAALEWLALYVSAPNADAFEFGSTLRQLKEVWQLTTGSDPGSQILPILHAVLLTREGGAVELRRQPEAASSPVAQEQQALEAVLGDTRFVSVAWYRTGLQRCDAVALIETQWGKGYGSGFLVRGEDMHPSLAGRVLLLTNAHVISDDPAVQNGIPPALPPARARVRFEGREGKDTVTKTYAIEKLLWTSPPGKLDASLLELDTSVTSDPPYPLAMALPAANKDRVYVIGHPGGGTLSLSLQDNRLIDVQAPKLHYRAPTEPGSSGSPVFNQDWELVAIHHAGGKQMRALSGTGLVEANEGIWISAIVEALKENLK